MAPGASDDAAHRRIGFVDRGRLTVYSSWPAGRESFAGDDHGAASQVGVDHNAVGFAGDQSYVVRRLANLDLRDGAGEESPAAAVEGGSVEYRPQIRRRCDRDYFMNR